MKFKIGDRVVVEESNVESEFPKHNKTGEIVEIDMTYEYPYLVCMDDTGSSIWCTVSRLVEEKKVFTKSDLRNGDILKKRNGDIEVVIVDSGLRIVLEARYGYGYGYGYNRLSDLNEDLTHRDLGDAYDIVAVRRPKKGCACDYSLFDEAMGELVYDRERDTIRELTIEEIEKEFGIKVKFERV